jgi:hypothetical protein
MRIDELLAGQVRVVNVGLEGFARDLIANGAAVVHVDWVPPRFAYCESTEKANAEVLQRILAAEPVLTDVRRAGDLIPGLEAGRLILHAGPPISWDRMCGPLRGAICGAVVFEGWAPDLAAAEELAASGAFAFAPNHHFGGREPGIRQLGCVHDQRGPGQGNALRRQRCRGARPARLVAR